MDRLSFAASEKAEYLQHTISLQIQASARWAKEGARSISTHISSALSQMLSSGNGNISFQSQLRWQWAWLMDHLSVIRDSLHQYLTNHGTAIAEFFYSINSFIQREMDQMHIYFCIGGILIGYLIGTHMKGVDKASSRMRALVCNSYNGVVSVAVSEDVVVPNQCGPNEVLIEVKASSIDIMDIRISLGYGKVLRNQYLRYNKAYGKNVFPIILGRECSGRIVEIGNQVEGLDVGDQVYAAVPYYVPGTSSEFTLVSADWVAKKPQNLSYEAAAVLPYSACQVWNALVEKGSLKPDSTTGKRILIHAVHNPAGYIAAQLIKAWGGHVTGTVTSRAAALATQLGVDDVIMYDKDNTTETDFNKQLSSRPKFDVVVNTLGTFLHESCLDICREGGVVITTVTAPPASDKYGFFLGLIYSVWLRIKYSVMKGPVLGCGVISSEILGQIANLVSHGHLQPIVDRIFDINQAALGIQYAAKGDTIGKPVIRFRNRPLSRMEGFA